MPSTYTELYYHLVWSTRGREKSIMPDIQPNLYRYIRAKCKEKGVLVYALNGIEDHVHLVCNIPSSISVAEVMQKVKGASAHHINHRPGPKASLEWQRGYGALTFSHRDLNMIIRYVERQQDHHRDAHLSPAMERLDSDSTSDDWQRAQAVRETSDDDYLAGTVKWDPTEWDIAGMTPDENENEE